MSKPSILESLPLEHRERLHRFGELSLASRSLPGALAYPILCGLLALTTPIESDHPRIVVVVASGVAA